MMTTTTNGANRAQEIPMNNIVTRRASLVTVVLLGLVACGGGGAAEEEATVEAPPAAPAMQVAQQNVATVDSFRIESGPSLSGTLVAERTAQLRPQANGTVLSVRVRAGDRVGAGQVIAVIDTLVLAEQARSARLGLTSAELAAATAERNVERSTQLHAAGAIADRDLEDARNQAAQARAMLEDARARVASANKMRDNAIVRAPFSGTVSELPVSVGDVVQMGGSVVAVVVDPSSLELEASVPASYFSTLRSGARVEFTVAAHPGRVFTGTVARVNAAVDATTGQLLMYVRVPNTDRTLAAGLFAEGRVAIENVRGLAIPTAALDARASSPSVKRVRGGKVEAVPVTLGLRDDLAERVEVTSGLSRGDTVLVGAAIGTPVGASVRFGAQDN
jgi:membrane fusion protein (multidrug efflux system)